VATAMAVLHQGAVPGVRGRRAADASGMDPAKVEVAITPARAPSSPVHLHGVPLRAAAHRRDRRAAGARAHRGLGTGDRRAVQGAEGRDGGARRLLQPAVQQEHGLGRGRPPGHRRRRTSTGRHTPPGCLARTGRPEDEASYSLAHALDGNRPTTLPRWAGTTAPTSCPRPWPGRSCGGSSTGTPRRWPARSSWAGGCGSSPG
jgi:hypothetical protein